MAKVDLYNLEGAVAGSVELSDAVFGLAEPNEQVVHQVVKAILANRRQGTSATKTRAAVRGGGRRPWRQKGTGRARHSSIRSPLWVGGGVTFGPQPRSYRQSVTRKMRRLAMQSALTMKAKAGQIVVIENLDLPEIKTKAVAQLLAKLPQAQSVLVVEEKTNDNFFRSARNIKDVNLTRVNTLNVYDILNHENLLLTKEAAAQMGEVFA